MRGLWTAGVTDVMMEHDIWPDGLIGVSAGAAFGCNYKSRQPGRAVRYNTRFARDSRYSGVRSWLTTGNYFNAEFGYRRMPQELDVFDNDAFNTNPMAFYVVCSASMPLASKVVEVQGRQLLDGGVADSIPLQYFESIGYHRNVVVLTQPAGYQKQRLKLMPLMRLSLRRYPKMIEAMERRHEMYNRQLEYVAQAEREGRCLVIRPEGNIPIGHISHDAARMQFVYQQGRTVGEKYLERIKDFYLR